MIEFPEQDDESAESGEAKAGQQPSSLPYYDPLMAPWDEPASPANFRVVEPQVDPAFHLGWTPAQGEEGLGWGAGPSRQQRQFGAWYPAGYQRPYQDREGLSDLRPQWREGTVALPRPGRRWAVTVREVAETILLALLIFLAVRASFQNFRVEGASMMPSLTDGEYLIVNKLAYAQLDLSIFDWVPFYDSGDHSIRHLWSSPGRGDVIVFRSPTNTDRDFIKRIIGVPGDTVEIDAGKNQVKVNGNVIEEGYVQGTTTCSGGCGPWEVPPADTPASFAQCASRACYFVMGDNRQNSSDSRLGWMVPEENIIGKALITYWRDGSPELKRAPNHSVPLTGEAAATE